MSDAQLYLTVAVAPVLSLMIVLAEYIVQNSNLNTRIAEMRTDFRDLLRAELSAIRAEMARNHSELLSKFADLDRRLSALEAERQHR